MDGNAINGMGMARQIRGMEQIKQPVIVFVTEYIYDAFEVEALGYLVKPVNEQKFAEVFSRTQDKILSETEQKKLYAVCMAAFFYPFMAGKKEQRKSRIKKVLMVFLIYTVMYFVNMAASVYGWLCMIIVIILLAAASKFLDMNKEFTFFWE